MQTLSQDGDRYVTKPRTTSFLTKLFPSLSFYLKFFHVVHRSSRLAQTSVYDDEAWWRSSVDVLRCVEAVGITIEVEGLANVRQAPGPVVFVGNHLSVMETVILPAFLVPYQPVTFVIKESLLEVPVFKHIMRTRDPIAVTRINPRHDLKIVLEQGRDRLARGISIIIFPQTTRAPFNPEQFSTIATKLAGRAGVPLIPLALLTDAWGNGTLIKDMGTIDPARKAHFKFGQPLYVEGKGTLQHKQVLEFIEANLVRWQNDRILALEHETKGASR